ncbi:MAG: outer membrane protein assembly factor BamA [Victivallales bacterium]|nr:outer membrane protein assembly factor BamA [Victivallales bacterium]
MATCLLLVFPVLMHAQNVRRMVFEQKGFEYSEQMLKYHIQTRSDSAFDRKVLDEDVKRLFESGYFLDVSADTERTADGRVDVVFKTRSRPPVRDIMLVGNQKYPETKLLDKITLEKGFPLNDKKLQDTLNNIREFYSDKGYLEVVVTPKVEDVGGGRVDVIINITENLRLKVNSVSFTGNELFYGLTLHKIIETKYSVLSWLFNVGLYDTDVIEADKIRIRNRYWEYGYLDFAVTSVDAVPLESNPEYVNVTFHMEEGEPYTVGKVSIAGNERFHEGDLLPMLELREGQVFDLRNEMRDIKALEMQYFPLGYADFNCNAERNADFATKRVDVVYRMTEGRSYMIHDINISGNRITKDKVIRRELPIQPGDPVDNALLEATKARLMGLGYFETVTIVSQDTVRPGEKDINIKVEEQRTARLTIGAGLSSEDGVMGSISFSQSNFDLFNPTNYFAGGGQRLNIVAELGTERQQAELVFIEPWLFDMPLRLKTEAYYRHRFYDKWREQHGGGYISLTKRFFDDFTSIEIGHRLEAVNIYHMSDKLTSKYFEGEDSTDFMSKTSILLSRDTRDSLEDPKSGYLLSVLGELNAASKTYYRLEFKASNYFPFFEDMFVLHTGLKYGVVGRIAGKSESGMAPLYERYFLGGGDTLRGFPFREVSPVDENGQFYGGQTMFLGNVELTHPIYEFIRGAVFMDFGGVWEDQWATNWGNNFNIGVGYGLRLKLPHFPSPIALDMAYPILNNQERVSNKLRFSFNMGFAW